MPFDDHLAERLRDLFGINPEISERKMFGGLAFMHRGHMCCGIIDRELMVRVGKDAYEPTLGEAHTRPMDFTGRPLTGMVMVDPAGLTEPAALRSWVERGLAYTGSLPPKKPSKPKPRKRLKTASKRPS